MGATINAFLRKQLVTRRDRLESAAHHRGHSAHVHVLLKEVDRALAGMEDGSFGICEICHEAVETERLICDPLTRICLDHFTTQEKTALERDLELAAEVQKALLPQHPFQHQGWDVCYHYEPAGLVSGDYCDIIEAGDGSFYFVVGDVSGKGLAASMLMTHMHAMFRTLMSVKLPLTDILKHASRVFSESTLPNQYATLVCGRAMPDGTLEICNAGHPPPMIVRDGVVEELDSADLPIGLFVAEEFSVSNLRLLPGEGLVMYSDGVSEANNTSGTEYTSHRLSNVIRSSNGVDASALVAACRDDLTAFRGQARKTDDATLFVLRRQRA
ncbi:MAG: SpoIIE family protein phosphatase [Acidobacteriaceae bacterium]|nr:SpoIIE family protein phosphatase [Acidobacteriaceae bacterium]